MRRLTILAVGLVIMLAGCGVGAAKKNGTHSGAHHTTVGNTQPQTTTGTAIGRTRLGSTVAATTGTTRLGSTAASTSEKEAPPAERGGKTGARTHAAAASAGWVSAIGDSVMLGTVDDLEQQIPNLGLFDAQGSRQMPAAIYVLKQERAAGYLGDAVVVDIGNNGPITAGEFDQMMSVLAGVRKVLIVNLTIPTYVQDPIAVPNNAVLAEGVKRYPKRAVLVDWHAASSGHPEYFWDGIHLTPQGAQAYARLIAAHLGGSKGPAATLPGPKESFSYGEGGTSGECVGPSSWCRTIISP